MNDYSIALYVHIVSVLGMFVALGVEWIGLSQIRSARDFGQIRVWMEILKRVPKLGLPSMSVAVVSGLYMMWRVWGGTPWLIVSIGALILVIALSQMLTRPRMMAIGRTLGAQKGPALSPVFHSLASHPLLWISIQTRVAVALGIVFLKVAKPDWTGSLLTLGIAIVLALVAALPLTHRQRVVEGSAE